VFDSVFYASRESVARSLDFQESASAYREIDDALLAAGDEIHGRLQRFFYPLTATRRFDWPNRLSGRTWRVWLNQWDLQELTSISSGGVELDTDDVILYPQSDTPPWNRVEVDRSSSSAFTGAATEQQAIAITGVFGVPGRRVARGALESSIASSSTTTVDVTDGRIEVGHAIYVGTEYLQVVERTPLDTTQGLAGAIDDSPGTDTVGVADGTSFTRGETILVDSERMWIRGVAANNLLVRRATDGSTIASHLIGADVYSFRRLTVERGIWGTTAAGHADSTSVEVYQAPPLIRTISKGVAENILLSESSGWGRTVGSGESEREYSGRGIATLWEEAAALYGRLRSYSV
jgi:hypothetical protein